MLTSPVECLPEPRRREVLEERRRGDVVAKGVSLDDHVPLPGPVHGRVAGGEVVHSLRAVRNRQRFDPSDPGTYSTRRVQLDKR